MLHWNILRILTCIAPTTSSVTQSTQSSGQRRRRRDADKECVIQNAECINNNCTCKANYVPSADLSKCNMESGMPASIVLQTINKMFKVRKWLKFHYHLFWQSNM